MQIQKEKCRKSWRNETNMEVFFSKKQKRECGENWTEEKKGIILRVKINNFDLDMQMDTGNAYTKKFLGTYWKANFTKEQFTTSTIWRVSHKILVFFEGSLELEDKFKVIPIMVTTCKKNHRLLGNDVLSINSTKLIDEIKMEKNWKVKKL